MGFGGAAPRRLTASVLKRWRAWAGATLDDTPIRTNVWARIALCVAIGLSFGLWLSWSTMRHRAFGTFGFDFGIFDQGVYLLSRFHSPFVTIMGVHLFGDHTSFILLPLVPVYWLFPSAEVLVAAQAVALSMAALPVFLIGRDRLRSEWLALGVAVAFLLNPALHWEGWEQFHPDVFEVPLALFALYFMTRRNWRWFFVFLVLLLGVKEDVPLMTFMLGVYIAWKHDRRVGIATAAVSVVWFVSAVWLVLPLFNGEGTLDAWRVPYGGIGGLLRATVTRPWDVIGLAFSGDRRWYAWQLFAGFGLVSALAPSALLIAAGPLASNLLSTFWYQYHLQYHYTTLIVAVLVFAAIVGIAHFQHRAIRIALVLIMVAAGGATGWLWGPSQLSRNPEYLGDSSGHHVAPINRALARVPSGAVVAAQYPFVTHLDHRKEIYEFPVPWYAQNWGDGSNTGQELASRSRRVQYIVVAPDTLAPRWSALLEYLTQREFAPVRDGNGVVVYKRVAAARPIPPELRAQLRQLSVYG